MTECNQESFEFEELFSRQVVARFDGGTISSDAGGLLLRETERRIRLLKRLRGCFSDGRNPARIEHGLEQMLAQRIYGLALGYEDLNDHDQLREDPLLAVLVGKSDPTGEDRIRPRDRGKPLAGKSTLNRLEQGSATPDRYKKVNYDAEAIDRLLVDLWLEAYACPPEEVILDLDTTDVALHGHQENRFFHGYYNHYCYLPLYIFSGEHLLCARLRPSNTDASAGSLAEIQRIVGQTRAAWPEVRIILRADSGFCREALMSWCEANQVDYVFSLARNERLRAEIESEMQEATALYAMTGKPARVFSEFFYQTHKSWSRSRRVVAKAEQIEGKQNPRFVVTSLSPQRWAAAALYEQLYCARGDMENRIKEQFSLFSDRLSNATMRANQFRLYLSSLAYVLLQALRRLGLRGTELASAQVSTLRLKLLKIGAQIRVTVRRVWVAMATGYAHQLLFQIVYQQLRS
jgi:transposase InsO family protein